ncbi:SWIM zinc finger family protein [Streptomyces thinghirensis]|nr:SWIM zinc finger family protein [Streptomyces thinghirensis]
MRLRARRRRLGAVPGRGRRASRLAALLDKSCPLPRRLRCPPAPRPRRPRPQCSCPDSGHPCKHAAALCYRSSTSARRRPLRPAPAARPGRTRSCSTPCPG